MKAKRVLVVEDDEITQKVIADVLTSAGYEVFLANSAAAAVQIARAKDPDVLTLDIELTKDSPDDSWDGFTVAAWLRRVNKDIRRPASW